MQVKLKFIITQYFRDELLFKSLIEYFEAGNVYKSREAIDFIITKISDITNKIIPFFKKYPIEGVKALDFADFCEAAEIMKVGGHLTIEGLKKIQALKSRMNRNRIS